MVMFVGSRLSPSSRSSSPPPIPPPPEYVPISPPPKPYSTTSSSNLLQDQNSSSEDSSLTHKERENSAAAMVPYQFKQCENDFRSALKVLRRGRDLSKLGDMEAAAIVLKSLGESKAKKLEESVKAKNPDKLLTFLHELLLGVYANNLQTTDVYLEAFVEHGFMKKMIVTLHPEEKYRGKFCSVEQPIFILDNFEFLDEKGEIRNVHAVISPNPEIIPIYYIERPGDNKRIKMHFNFVKEKRKIYISNLEGFAIIINKQMVKFNITAIRDDAFTGGKNESLAESICSKKREQYMVLSLIDEDVKRAINKYLELKQKEKQGNLSLAILYMGMSLSWYEKQSK